MPLGNFLLLIAALWTAFLLSGCSAPPERPSRSLASVENQTHQANLPNQGPMPFGWEKVKAGITKEEVHAILGQALYSSDDGVWGTWKKRQDDVVWTMKVHFDKSNRVRSTRSAGIPALVPNRCQPTSRPFIIPAPVVEETERQIQAYLGSTGRKGIPLLDRSIDWRDLRHWPDQLSLGEELLASYASETSYDSSQYVGSKMELTHPNSVSLSYWDPAKDPHFRTGPYAYWSRSMQIYEQGFRWNGKRVFHYSLYSNGRLQTFERDDSVSGAYHSDLFNENGKLMGQVRGGLYFWKQKQVSQDEYYNRMFKMWGIKREP